MKIFKFGGLIKFKFNSMFTLLRNVMHDSKHLAKN